LEFISEVFDLDDTCIKYLLLNLWLGQRGWRNVQGKTAIRSINLSKDSCHWSLKHLRFGWMFVSCRLQVVSKRPDSKQSELVGVSVCGNCRRREPGIQMSTESRRNANFNTRKTLEPPLKQRISAIKHSLLLHLVEDYVIDLGCDLYTLIWISHIDVKEHPTG
jgi:hypothetical protein